MPSRLLHGTGQGRTEIRLAGGGELVVMESPRDVLAQTDAVWMVLVTDKEQEVHLRPSAVAVLIDLDHHSHGEETHLRSVRPDYPAA